MQRQVLNATTGDITFVEITQEEILAVVDPQQPDPKLVGIEFQGVMCSATKDDQNGLMAVLMAIQIQGQAFPPTQFEFQNGNSLIITLANYQSFMAAWLPFRQSFFVVQ